ncbi:MAG: extracellular solute-binding protein [Lachnospiraceae bacterium]
MNNMVNKILAWVLVMLVFLAGGFFYVVENNMFFAKSQTLEDEVLYFWYTDNDMTSYYNNAAGTYNLEQENVMVIPQLVSGSEYLENIYNISIAGGDVPDVYVISNDSLEKAYLAGLTIPIDEKDSFLDNFSDTAIDAVTYKDNILGYPYYYETSALVYNKTFLEEIAYQLIMTPDVGDSEEGEENVEIVSFAALSVEEKEALQAQVDTKVLELLPNTVTELYNLANSIIAPTGMEYIFTWDINEIFFNYFYVGAYMEVGGESGDDSSVLNIYNENTVECLGVFQALAEFFYMDPDEVTTESIITEFLEGKVLFSIVDSHAADSIELANANGELAFEYGYSMIPDPSEELNGRSLSVTSTVVVNGYTDHTEYAHDFAQFLTGEYTENLYDKTGQLTSNQNTPTVLDVEKVFRFEYEKSIPMPKMMATSNFWMYLEAVFSAVWEGADINTELESLQNKMQEQIIQ